MRVLVTAALVAGALAGCATAHRAPAVAANYVGCRVGQVRTPDLYCGAQVGGPAQVLCALHGRTVRRAAWPSGLFAVTLADSSYVTAGFQTDSAGTEGALDNLIFAGDPCTLDVYQIERRWQSTVRSEFARARYLAVKERIGERATDSIFCRTSSHDGVWRFLRESISSRGLIMREIYTYRSSDDAEAKINLPQAPDFAGALTFTRLGEMRVIGTDTSTVRRRYVMRTAWFRDGQFTRYSTDPVESGAAACDRMEQRALVFLSAAND